MKRLAGLFSVAALLFLTWGGWVLLRPAPQLALLPEGPGIGVAPGLERLPGLPDLGIPDTYLPQTAPDEIELVSPVDRILVEKSAQRMTVYQRQGPPKTYRIALGFSPDGDKSRQGDGRTPEGIFRIDRLNPQSRFHLSLGIDYPQPRHREAARRAGHSPGGDIMIHGQPNQIPDGFRVKGDWTEGCIAVADHEMDEIFAMTRLGTEVEIRP